MYYLQVAVPLFLFDLYTYKSEILVKPGCRVQINFRNNNIIGVVMNISNNAPNNINEKIIKKIDYILDTDPYWNDQTIQLIQFTAKYQHMPIGEIIELAQPVALRKGAPATLKPIKAYKVNNYNYIPKNDAQNTILKYLKVQPLTSQELKGLNISTSAINTLVKNKVIESFDLNTIDRDIYTNLCFDNKFELNDEQKNAYNAICNSLNNFKVFLLQGITGSGKTEVYMQIIEQVLIKRKQVLVMIPEIGLTPQTIDRFHNHFNVPIAAMHSALSNRERLDNYLECRDGKIGILIGTRSSVFTPFKNLGLVIIDEEHDSSYKQQDTCRYNGKNLAIYKAKIANCPVILGSATPNLESLYNAQIGKYEKLTLTKRAFTNPGTVTTEIIDIKNTTLNAGISPRLLEEIKKELDKGNQVLIFLNRRGYANHVLCQNCGNVLQCLNCDSYLTYHKARHIVNCHHCESSWDFPKYCPKCGSNQLTIEGNGTEQIEEYINQVLPNYPTIRFDRDTVTKPKDLQSALDGVLSEKYKIIIGTQIIAKGHHFPNVTLIALINIDSALFSNDFRSTEQLAQLYTQVAGRTGREEKPGKIILQSYVPNHTILQTIVGDGYDKFANFCLEERKYMNLPPYSNQALIRIEGKDQQRVYAFTDKFYKYIICLNQNNQDISINLPYQALMERKQNKYHMLIMLQSTSRVKLGLLLDSIQKNITTKHIEMNGINYYIDVDPTEVTQ